MDTVIEILDQIKEEEEKSGLFDDENFSYMAKKKNKNNNNKSNFDFRNIFKDIKEYIQDFKIETETIYSILFSLIIIILSFSIWFFKIEYEEYQNSYKMKDNEGKE